MVTIFRKTVVINNNHIRIINRKKKSDRVKFTAEFKDVKYTRKEERNYG